MKFKAIITTGLMALMFVASAASAKVVKVGIAAEPYPPFASLNASGKWVGWEIDIIHAICNAEKLDCVLTPIAWDGIIPALTGKQIDVIMASMSITAARKKKIDFSNMYYNTPAVIVADKTSKITPTPAGLAGKILGVQVSTIHQAYAEKYFAAKTQIKTYQTQDEANQDLAAGRVDAILADSIAMSNFVASPAGACCAIKGAVANDTAILGNGVGAGVRKGDNALLEKINAGIAKILADGTYKAISKKYFKTSIYSK